jgi:dephospho-CoA kinase
VGSGKSTVAVLFGNHGVPVIDADEISHALTKAGSAAMAEIAETFGARFIDAAGNLDRAAMRALVFSDSKARAKLESILHPRIRSEMLRRLEKLSAPYAVLEMPLLFETGQADIADRVLVVDLPQPEQLRRVRQRSGLATSEVQRIMASQVSRRRRLEGAHDIIDNSGDPGRLHEQVNRMHRFYVGLATKADA